jgi:glutathione S-transferase
MIKLHGFPMSPNTKRALLGLEEVSATYEFVPVDLMSGEHRRAEYLALNPTGRVPVLVDGSFVLWESNAILQYLAATFPDKKLDGDGPAGRAKVAQWLFMNAAHLSPAFAHVFAHTIRLPEDKRIPQLVENGRVEIERGLKALEGQLASGPYVLGALTIADLSLAATVAVAPMLNVDLSVHPKVAAWMQRMQERPSFKKVNG